VGNILLTQTSEVNRRHLSLSLAKPRQNTEAIFKARDLFVYGDIYYINLSFCKNVLKTVTL